MVRPTNIGVKQRWQTATLTLLFMLIATTAHGAATPRADVWQPNGPVFATEMAKDAGADSVYIGGDFTYVGPDTGNSVLVSLSGSHLPSGTSWPKISGDVHSAVWAGNDTWYVGGNFTTINGGADNRNRLARFKAVDGVWSVDATWNPDIDGTVRTMVLAGTTLYIGGDFTMVGGAPRNRLAAFDLADSGNEDVATSWDPNVNGVVRTMAIDSAGTTLYVGGDFTTVGGPTRNRLAAFDLADSGNEDVATSWNPNVNGVVRTMAIDTAGTTLYVGGDFTGVNTGPVETRNRLAAIDTISGTVDPGWDPDVTGTSVNSIALNGITLYVGGDFTGINPGPLLRNHIAAINTADGLVTNWTPALPFLDASGVSVSQVKVGGSEVYVGWNGMLDGDQLGRMQAIDPTSGLVDWSVAADSDIYTIQFNANDLILGGAFGSGGGRLRRNLAEINIGTGEGGGAATDWNIVVNGPVHSIAAKDDGVGLYIGGTFTQVTGSSNTTDTRNNIAFLGAANSAVEQWDPSVTITSGTVEVRALALSPNQATLYIGGQFDAVATLARQNIASLNTTVPGVGGANVVNTWYPGPGADFDVNALVVSSDNNLVFAGGAFTTIGAVARERIAAIKVGTGVPLSDELWAVTSVNNIVRTLSLSSDDKTLYMGGDFTSIADGTVGSPYTRNRIAALAVDESSGKWSVVTTVDPNVSTGTSVYSLGLSSDDQMLWMGGQFTMVTGNTDNSRANVARYNLTEAAENDLTAWNPVLTGGTGIVYANDRTVGDSLEIVGGDFTLVGGVAHKYLAVFDTSRPTVTNGTAGGFYNTSSLDIALSCAHNTTAGPCSIFYTTDGSEPTQALTPYNYIQPPPPPPDPPPPPTTLSISADTVLKFFARDANGSVSETLSTTYVIDQTFPTTVVQLDAVLKDVLPNDGVFEVPDVEVTFSLACEDAGGANCDKSYFTTDGTDPHKPDGKPADGVRFFDTPLTPRELLPLESLTLDDLVGAETDVFYDMTLADIITTEQNAAIRVDLNALTLGDIPRNAVNLNSIDLQRVRAYVDLAAVRLDTLSDTLLANVILDPDAVPDGAETLADVEAAGIAMDLTQITLGSITGTAYSLSEIPMADAPPPAYVTSSQVPLIDVQLDGTEDRTVLNAVRLAVVPLAAIPVQFIPGSRLYGLIDLKFFSIDRAGNSEILDTGLKTERYYVDIGPPRTTASPNTDDNVFTSAINVELICLDYGANESNGVAGVGGAFGSGCDKTYYTTDGSVPTPENAGPNRPTKLYTGSIPVSNATVIRYMSIDKMGNVEEVGFDVYAFTFESSGRSGVGASSAAAWLLALFGLWIRRSKKRAAI